MVDNYRQHHLTITTIEADHLINITDTRVTKVIDHIKIIIIIIADTPACQIVKKDRSVTTDLTVTIDRETDTITITADHKAIKEVIITTLQIPEIAAIVIIEIIAVQIRITETIICHETI